MQKSKIRVVIDTGVFIPCGDLLKPKDDENLYKRLCKKYNQAKNVKVRLPHEFIEIMENPA